MALKKIKKLIATVAWTTVPIVVKMLSSKSKKDDLLIIKTDEIGDYILFRCYLKYFKESETYKNSKITLLGNIAWKQIFEEYDHDLVDDIIWVDKKKFNKSLAYRFGLFRKVSTLQTSTVVNCIYSRSLLLDDGFAYVASGRNKFAMKGDNTNRGKSGKNFDKVIYTSVIDAGGQEVFDAVRTRNFISEILKAKVKLENRLEPTSNSMSVAKKYFILFLGAGNPERKWPLDHFLEIASYVQSKHGLIPCICGGKEDMPDAEAFLAKYKKNTINYAGKTSLLQLIELLSKAEFLICVDTGILHIAAAVGCPVIGLYSGKFYGRFAPYPKELTAQFYPVYPDFVDTLIANADPVLYDTFTMKNNTNKMIEPNKLLPYIDIIVAHQ